MAADIDVLLMYGERRRPVQLPAANNQRHLKEAFYSAFADLFEGKACPQIGKRMPQEDREEIFFQVESKHWGFIARTES